MKVTMIKSPILGIHFFLIFCETRSEKNHVHVYTMTYQVVSKKTKLR